MPKFQLNTGKQNTPQFSMFGPQTNQPQQAAPMSYTPWQDQQVSTRPKGKGFENWTGGAYQAGVNAQAQKDIGAFGALQNLGIAGQNAMGQYGAAQANALANSQIAQANALGQLGAGYYNTMGQLGQANAGMVAAASAAGADSNKAAALGGLASGMVNAGMYGASMAPYTAGNMPNFNFGGFGGPNRPGGFRVSGPEGTIASGGMGPRISNDQGFGPPGDINTVHGAPDGRNFNQPPTPPYMSGGNMPTYNPYVPFQMGTDTLRGMLGQMGSENSMANLVRQDMNSAFRTTQGNLMNSGIRQSLNAQLTGGYRALGNLYDGSDYGFRGDGQRSGIANRMHGIPYL